MRIYNFKSGFFCLVSSAKRLLLCAISCYFFSVSVGYAAISPVASWQVSEHKPSKQSSAHQPMARYCLAKVNFENNTEFVFAQDLSGALSLAYKSSDVSFLDNEYSVFLSIDGQFVREYSATSSDPSTLIIQPGHDADFVSMLMAGHSLHLQAGDYHQVFSLHGSADGLRALRRCVTEANNGRDVLNMKLSSIQPVTPLAGTAASRTNNLSMPSRPTSSAAIGGQRLDSYNDPSRTYIRVHFPEDVSSSVDQQVNLRDRSELKAQKHFESCQADNEKLSLIRDFVDTHWLAKLKLVADKDFQLSDKVEPVKWQRNAVNAHFLLLPAYTDGATVQTIVLDDLHQSCQGDFAVEKMGTAFHHGLRSHEYAVACMSNDYQLMGNLHFISDGFETAVFSFETTPEEFENIIVEKEILLGDI